jgi:hypothetical protein
MDWLESAAGMNQAAACAECTARTFLISVLFWWWIPERALRVNRIKSYFGALCSWV